MTSQTNLAAEKLHEVLKDNDIVTKRKGMAQVYIYKLIDIHVQTEWWRWRLGRQGSLDGQRKRMKKKNCVASIKPHAWWATTTKYWRRTAFIDIYIWPSQIGLVVQRDNQPIIMGYRLGGKDWMSAEEEATSLALLGAIAAKTCTGQPVNYKILENPVERIPGRRKIASIFL